MSPVSLNFPILTRRSTYNGGTKYTDYREEIREDCQCRCAYCNTHEFGMGGPEAMQLDHFEPHSRFPLRKHDPLNLLWSCNRCNLLKRDDWHPADATGQQKFGYIDPFTTDRNNYFRVEANGELIAINDPAAYMIQRLRLNRDFLIYIRRSRHLIEEFQNKVTKYFDDECKDYEKRLKEGAIKKREYEKKVATAQGMKTALLKFIETFSFI